MCPKRRKMTQPVLIFYSQLRQPPRAWHPVLKPGPAPHLTHFNLIAQNLSVFSFVIGYGKIEHRLNVFHSIPWLGLFFGHRNCSCAFEWAPFLVLLFSCRGNECGNLPTLASPLASSGLRVNLYAQFMRASFDSHIRMQYFSTQISYFCGEI